MSGVLKARQFTARYVSAGIVESATNLSAEGTILLEPCAGILISYAVPSGLIPYPRIQNPALTYWANKCHRFAIPDDVSYPIDPATLPAGGPTDLKLTQF